MRLAPEIARRVREGHPWIFSEALRGRRLSQAPGDVVDVVDTQGDFVARALADPGGPLCLRVFSRTPAAALDPARIREVLATAAEGRRSALDVDLSADGCCRVLNGDSEGLPAVNVDRYADYLVVSFYSAIAERFLDPLLDGLVDLWRPRGIYLQRRYLPAPAGKPRPPGALVRGLTAPTEIVVREGRTRFAVDVTAPLGTGLFPDMRQGRAAVTRLAAGRRVLNCFSYTGAFSVVAAMAGAMEVVSVDTAARAHGRARHNFTLNNVNPAPHAFITGDAFATLARFVSQSRSAELLILDPPTFSSGAKGRAFTAIKDYAELTAAALPVMPRGGLLLAASNAAKLPHDDFERALGRGAAQAGRELVISERLSQPSDYPASPAFSEGRYLKLVVCRVL